MQSEPDAMSAEASWALLNEPGRGLRLTLRWRYAKTEHAIATPVRLPRLHAFLRHLSSLVAQLVAEPNYIEMAKAETLSPAGIDALLTLRPWLLLRIDDELQFALYVRRAGVVRACTVRADLQRYCFWVELGKGKGGLRRTQLTIGVLLQLCQVARPRDAPARQPTA